MTDELCTIAFQSAAYDTAADYIRQLKGYGVDAYLSDGRMIEAFIEDVVADPDSGEWCVHLREIDHSNPAPNAGGALHMVNIYTELERMEVV